jgi:hypothetical protein
MSRGGDTAVGDVEDELAEDVTLLLLLLLLLLLPLPRKTSLLMSISMDLALMAKRYFGKILFRLANINTMRVVLRQLTFSWDKLFIFMMLIMRHKKRTRLSNKLK